jgi:hypothetical protein
VSWDATYRDVVKFGSRAARDNYLNQRGDSLEIENMTYARPGLPVVLPVPITDAQRFNYIRVTNERIPGGGDDGVRSYCYFILGVEYSSPGATTFMLQLDVWQTYVYDVSFNQCYIERGHIGIANSNAFDGYGRDFLSIPEGLDIGNEYQVIARKSKNVMTENEDYFEDPVGSATREREGFAVLMATTVHIGETPGTENAPILETARGSDLQGMPSGTEYYVFKSAADFRNFMIGYAKYPWITQGIISVTIIPKPGRYGYKLDPVTLKSGDPQIDAVVEMYTIRGDLESGNGTWYNMFPNWRNSPEILNKIPERYRKLKKLLTFPYMMIELTTFTGTPVILKPEVWTDVNARIQERASLVPPNQRIVFSPFRYNALEDAPYDTYKGQDDRVEYLDDGGEYMDMSTQISNFPSMAVVNNGAIGFMASNTHGIAYQHQSANWSQQKALQGAQTGYQQSGKGLEAGRAQGDISRYADAQGTTIDNNMAVMNAGVQAGGALMSGSPQGLIGGLYGAGTGLASQMIGSNQHLGNRLQTSQMSQDVAQGLGQYMRNSNLGLAEFVAKGDYSQAIAGINARVQDAQLTQPSVSGQTGGEAFNIIHHLSKISLRWKMMSKANIRANGEYWLRYGYAVQMFADLPESLMCMTNFTYWKLLETYITGAAPESMKQTIRGILEKGVTVWRSPDIIGQIDIADNDPLGGIAL